MPPSHQSPSTGKVAAVSSGEEVSRPIEPRERAIREFRLRKSARLVEMVNALQKSMEAMISKRQYYAQRSTELEQALTQRAPEALHKCITISTIKVADIMMELEDLHEKKTELEQKVQSLQQNEDIERNIMELEVEKLQARCESLEQEALEKEKALQAKLNEANEEVATIQKKYAKTRKEYHTCTRSIATMALKISSLQRENNNLRVEAGNTHQALIEMEQQFEALKRGNALESIQQRHQQDSNHMIQYLQSQLETSRFENEKLIAERTANHSVIQEMQKQVQELQAALREQQNKAAAAERTAPTPYQPSFPIFATDFSRSVQSESTHSDETESNASNLDNLLSIVRSMSGHSSSASTEIAANTSKRYDSDDSDDSSDSEDDYDPYSTNFNRASRKDDTPNMIRRMGVTINGVEGSYTGPLGSNGLPNGTGTIRFKNGDTYLGTLKDGQLHGKGAMYYSSNRKTTFRGMFMNNNPVM